MRRNQNGDFPAVRMQEYFRSLSREFEALKDRVRYLINDRHWQTDGEWKESVLRSVLQRTLPQNMVIGRGFVVGRRSCSRQIDILIYDSSYPTLYKDGDLVFISPSSCRAIIEVKTRLTNTSLRETVDALAENAELVRSAKIGRHRIFTGLFVYEDCRLTDALEILRDSAGDRYQRIVDHVSIGSSRFLKFWARNPENGQSPYKQWHDYELYEMAQGYFAHNLTTALAPDVEARQDALWFPERGKEIDLRDSCEFQGRIPALPPFRLQRARAE